MHPFSPTNLLSICRCIVSLASYTGVFLQLFLNWLQISKIHYRGSDHYSDLRIMCRSFSHIFLIIDRICMQFCWYAIIPLFDRLCKHLIWIINNLVFIVTPLLSNILECLKNPDFFGISFLWSSTGHKRLLSFASFHSCTHKILCIYNIKIITWQNNSNPEDQVSNCLID